MPSLEAQVAQLQGEAGVLAQTIYVVHQTDGYDVHSDIGYFYDEKTARECAAFARKQERARNRKAGLGRHYDLSVSVRAETVWHAFGGWLQAQQEEEQEATNEPSHN